MKHKHYILPRRGSNNNSDLAASNWLFGGAFLTVILLFIAGAIMQNPSEVKCKKLGGIYIAQEKMCVDQTRTYILK